MLSVNDATMSAAIIWLAVLSVSGTTAAEKWYKKNGFHYYFSNVQTSWGDAQANCARMGAKLTTIDSVKENSYLLRRNPADDPRSGMTAHWIGLKGFCTYDSCSWQWDGGADVIETELLWAPGYPDTEQYLTYAYLGKYHGNTMCRDYMWSYKEIRH